MRSCKEASDVVCLGAVCTLLWEQGQDGEASPQLTNAVCRGPAEVVAGKRCQLRRYRAEGLHSAACSMLTAAATDIRGEPLMSEYPCRNRMHLALNKRKVKQKVG